MAGTLRALLAAAVLAALAGCDSDTSFGGAYDPDGSACTTTNPLTGACSCPEDFETLTLAEAGVALCWSDESDAGWEWGGAYDADGSGCATANPRTGDCSCPVGFTQLFLVQADATLCWAQEGTQDGWRFGGGFDSAVAGDCITTNPQTGACSCPDGFEALALAQAGFTLCRGV